MCLQDEKKKLHAAITKSDSMKKENSKCKENMDMEVAQCRMQLAVEKEKGKCLLGDTHPSPSTHL
jgi:ATP phosphoribosyltransferase